jgi:outer membrane protein
LARFPLITGIASDGTARTVPQYPNGTGAASTTLREVSGINTNYVPTFTIGLQVSVPIYDQGTTNYNVANAAALLDQAFATLQQTRLQVQSDVRTALANLISARALLVETQAELISGRVSLDATQAQYRVGATTIINVVTAEANLASAQSAYITSLYGVQTAQQNYLYATGLSDIQL